MPPPTSQRLTALDAARATAVLLICTAHFVDIYNNPYPNAGPTSLIVQMINAICRIATPTFFLVSGTLLGYLSTTQIDDFPRIRRRLLDRAIFLATIGHLLIAVAWAPRSGLLNALSIGFVTDTIAVCIIGGLLLFPDMKHPTTRIWIGALLYLTGWAGWGLWHPDNPVLVTVRGIFLGPDEDGYSIFYDPLLPWFGVYLIGTALGNWIGTFQRDDLHCAGRTLAQHAATLFMCILSLNVLILSLNTFGGVEIPSYLLALGKKYPPGPSYILLFGSAALLLIGGMLSFVGTRQSGGSHKIVECLGRNAFAILVVQYFLYDSALFLLETKYDKPTILVAIALYIGSILGIIWLGTIFDRFRVSRFWTVGLPFLEHNWPVLSRPIKSVASFRSPVVYGSFRPTIPTRIKRQP